MPLPVVVLAGIYSGRLAPTIVRPGSPFYTLLLLSARIITDVTEFSLRLRSDSGWLESVTSDTILG